MSLPAGPYTTDPFTLGLYHFDSASVDSVYDYSGHDMDGTLDGITRISGEFGNALFFDDLGNDICVVKPDTDHYIGPRWGGFTVEGWFNAEDISQGERVLVSRGRGSEFQFDLVLDGNNTVVGRAYDTESQSVAVSSSVIQEQEWFHAAMTLDEDSLQLYINGNKVDAEFFVGELAGKDRGTVIDTMSILVGRDWEGLSPFNGRIDELRISDIGRQIWEFNVEGARVAASPSDLDFGEVLLGYERTRKLWVSNPGIDVLVVDSIVSSNSSIFSVDVTSFNIQPGDSQLVRVTYIPSDTLSDTGYLTLDTNDPSYSADNPMRVFLEGNGISTGPIGPYQSDLFTVALYHFNEGSGTVFGDSSGIGLHGTLHGNMAWSDSGRFGKSLRFDGINDWGEVPSDSFLNVTVSDFTVELWFSMLSKPTNSYTLLRRGDGDTTQIELRLDKNKGIVGSVWDTPGVQDTLFTGTLDELNVNQWYHVVLSWDGDSLRLYLNNVVRSAKRLSGSFRFRDTEPLFIGGSDLTDRYFHGHIDEMRISGIAREEWEFHVLPPQIVVFPTELMFATVLVGQSRTLRFWTTNGGDQDLVISSITGGGGIFTIPDTLTEFTLPRQKSKEIPVTFTPDPDVPDTTYSVELTVVSNDSDVTVSLEGSSTDKKGMDEYPEDSHTLALYHFSETAGDTVQDVSGEHDGVLRGGMTRTASGFFGRGLYFDGVNDRVEIAYDSDLAFDLDSESFTVEFFFRTDTVFQALMYMGIEDSANYGFFLTNEGRLEVEGVGVGGSRVSGGSWHHVAFTYNHLTHVGKLYVDGGLERESYLGSGDLIPMERSLIIGAVDQGDGSFYRHFEGYVDEVRISDIVREPWEFQIAEYGIEVSTMDLPETGSPLTLDIHVPEELEATGVAVFYREGGAESYDDQDATSLTDSTYRVELPATAITLQGLEYYVQVVTVSEDTLTYPLLDPQNNPVAEVVRHNGMEAPLIFQHEQFQMFSIPFQLDLTSVESVLEDDLGSYDPYQWRLFWWWRTENEYIDYNPETKDDPFFFKFNPGRAYWMITHLNRTCDIGPGQTVSTDSRFL